MIELREFMQNEVEEIKNIFGEETVEDRKFDGIIYVALEDEKIIGISKVKKEKFRWILVYLIIRNDNRGNNLGDSLLRAILNKLHNNGVEHIYYRSNNCYLSKKGFKSINNEAYSLNISEFFNVGCKSCGELNEI